MTPASMHNESVARSTRPLFKTVDTLWHLCSVEREKTPLWLTNGFRKRRG